MMKHLTIRISYYKIRYKNTEFDTEHIDDKSKLTYLFGNLCLGISVTYRPFLFLAVWLFAYIFQRTNPKGGQYSGFIWWKFNNHSPFMEFPFQKCEKILKWKRTIFIIKRVIWTFHNCCRWIIFGFLWDKKLYVRFDVTSKLTL